MTGAEPTLKPVLHRDGTVDPASVPLPLSSSSSPRVPRATQQKRKRTVQIESVLEEEEEDDEDDDGDSSRRIRGRPRVAAKNESAADVSFIDLGRTLNALTLLISPACLQTRGMLSS